MSYTVEITLVDPPNPEGDEELPIYQLPDAYDTLAEAKVAAGNHIVSLGRPPGSVLFDVQDSHGVSVVSAEQPSPC